MPAPDDGGDTDQPSELELSAVGEASNQMMAAAAGAIGVVLGQEIEISPPDIRVLADPAAAAGIYGTSPHATSTTFLIAGEACRLIQLVPAAFVVRMARALDELNELLRRRQATAPPAANPPARRRERRWRRRSARSSCGCGPSSAAPTSPWAGRSGSRWAPSVELNQEAEAPIDLFVNGVRFAQGHLIVTDDGEWAFQCDAVGGRPGSSRHPLPLNPRTRRSS